MPKKKDELTRQEAISVLFEDPPGETDLEWRERMEKKLNLILSVIVVQQKDFCEAVGMSPDTVRNKVLSGETEVLQRDGSRLNYLTLEQAGELKPRRNSKRRK